MPSDKEFKLKISAESGELKRNVEGALDSLSHLSGGLVGGLAGGLERLIVSPLGAVVAAIGAVAVALREIIGHAREINNISVRGGMSQRQAAGFISGVEHAGAEPEEMMGMFNRLRRAQSLAMGNEASAQAKAFRELGISFKEVQETLPVDLFIKLTQALAAGTITGEKFAAMTRILGRDFGTLTVAAREGLADKIKEGMMHAPSDEEIAKARELERTLREGKLTGKEALRESGGWLLGKVNDFFAAFAGDMFKQIYSPNSAKTFAPTARELGNTMLGPPAPPPGSAQEEARLKAQQLEDAKHSQDRAEQIRLLETQAQQLEDSNKNFQKISPDKFARMGLFLTGGTEKLTNELVGLNRQSVAELKNIKEQLKELKQGVSDGGFDTF